MTTAVRPSVDERYLVDLVARMVRVDSVLPHEENLARLVADEIRSLGLEPEWQVVAPGRPNVYASARLGAGSGFVTFTGHLDTVGVAAGWQTNPFEPVIREGQMYGLGAADMKSGLACAFAAFKALYEAKELHAGLGKIGFAATVDEEGYGSGAKALLATPFAKSDLLLLAEPFNGSSPEDPIAIGMTGKILYRVIVRGRTTHGFTPERGVNAVEDAARIVAALPGLPLGGHPRIGTGNYSVLKFEGGYREYAVVVPEHCVVVITRLLVPGETRDSAVKDLRQLIDALALHSEVAIETPPPFYEPYLLADDHPSVRCFAEAYAAVVGRRPLIGGRRGIVDGNIYMVAGGIPTITYGPLGHGLHEAGEHVALATLSEVTNVYMETALRFMQ